MLEKMIYPGKDGYSLKEYTVYDKVQDAISDLFEYDDFLEFGEDETEEVEFHNHIKNSLSDDADEIAKLNKKLSSITKNESYKRRLKEGYKDEIAEKVLRRIDRVTLKYVLAKDEQDVEEAASKMYNCLVEIHKMIERREL